MFSKGTPLTIDIKTLKDYSITDGSNILVCKNSPYIDEYSNTDYQ